jgi:dTMP kinase
VERAGFFITFEGAEGAGKTTQSQRLAAELETAGYTVLFTHEPGGTRISERIREIVLNREYREIAPTTELLLFAASRAQLVSERIVPALNNGHIVISDRFVDSTVAYQGYARGFEHEVISYLNRVATNGLSPDLTIVLDLPVEAGLQRKIRQDREAMNRLDLEYIKFHQRVREGFLEIARKEPKRVKMVNAQMTPECVYQAVKAEVDGRMEKWANRRTSKLGENQL